MVLEDRVSPSMIIFPVSEFCRPDVHFHCDLSFDPFLFMEDRNKTYGWTITMYEFEKTIPTLWGHVQDFMKLHPQYVAEGNAMGFMSPDGGMSYNLCHCWYFWVFPPRLLLIYFFPSLEQF